MIPLTNHDSSEVQINLSMNFGELLHLTICTKGLDPSGGRTSNSPGQSPYLWNPWHLAPWPQTAPGIFLCFFDACYS